jgi:hypothetical protein
MDQPQKAKTFVFGASKLTPNPTDRRKITPDADWTQHRITNPEYGDLRKCRKWKKEKLSKIENSASLKNVETRKRFYTKMSKISN